MNNTKFTPGPWEQNYICAASTNEVKATGNRIALVLQYDDKQNRVADFETCEANAKLIAAAPCLLEALIELMDYPEQDLKDWAESPYSVTMTFTPGHILKALNAIKKATE